eukprot:EG_transcript_1563
METKNNVLVVSTSTVSKQQLIHKLSNTCCVCTTNCVELHFESVYSSHIFTKYYNAVIHYYLLDCNPTSQLHYERVNALPFHGIVLVFDVEDIASWNALQLFVKSCAPFHKADVCVCVGLYQHADAKCLVEGDDIDGLCQEYFFEYCAIPWDDTGSAAAQGPPAEKEGLARLREALESTMWPDYAPVKAGPSPVDNSGPDIDPQSCDLPLQPQQDTPSEMNHILVVGGTGCGNFEILRRLVGSSDVTLQPAPSEEADWSLGRLYWSLETPSLAIPIAFSFLAADQLSAKQRNSLRRSGALHHFAGLILVHAEGDADSLDILTDFLATFPLEGPPPWGTCLRLCLATRQEGRLEAPHEGAALTTWCAQEGLQLQHVSKAEEGTRALQRCFEAAPWLHSTPRAVEQPAPSSAGTEEATAPDVVGSRPSADGDGYHSLPDHADPAALRLPPALWLPMFRAAHPNRVAVVGPRGCGKRWLIGAMQSRAAARCQDDKAVKQRRATVPYGFMQEVFTLSLRTKYYTTTVDFYPIALDWLTPEESQLLSSPELLRSFHGLLLVHDPARPDTLQAIRDWLADSPATDGLEIRLCVTNHAAAGPEQPLPKEVHNWFATRQFECLTVPHSPSPNPGPPATKPQSTLKSPCLTGLDRLYECCEFTKWPSAQLAPDLIDTKPKLSGTGSGMECTKAPKAKPQSGGALFAAMKPGFLTSGGKPKAKAKPKAASAELPPKPPADTGPAAPADQVDPTLVPAVALRDNPNRMLFVLGAGSTETVETLLDSVFPACRRAEAWGCAALPYLHGVHVCHMTTKYYVADLEVYWAAAAALPLPGVPQAVLDAFDTAVLVCDARQPGSLEAVQAVADGLVLLQDCKLLVMLGAEAAPQSVTEAHDWAVDNGWELVCCPGTPGGRAEDGPRRLHDALAAAKWHIATMVAQAPAPEEAPVSSGPRSGAGQPLSASAAGEEGLEEEMDGFDRLVAQVMQMRLNGASMGDEARRERAAELCARMLRLSGEDEGC